MTDEEIFNLVRENYVKVNSDYIAEQIKIASEFISDEHNSEA